jgi:hypothetical protein
MTAIRALAVAGAILVIAAAAPLGILDRKTGKAYLAVLDHEELMGGKQDAILKKLEPHVAKQVVAPGRVVERGDLTGFLITTVRPAQ